MEMHGERENASSKGLESATLPFLFLNEYCHREVIEE